MHNLGVNFRAACILTEMPTSDHALCIHMLYSGIIIKIIKYIMNNSCLIVSKFD